MNLLNMFISVLILSQISFAQTWDIKPAVLCTKSFPPRCFIQGEDLERQEIMVDNKTGKPLLDDEGNYILKPKD